MNVENKVSPNEEQIKGFFEPGPEGPICMVNLLKFKDKAEYEDGRETTLSGREAYAIYAEGVADCLKEVGGYPDFKGDVERLTLGEVDELWDMVALAVYPSRDAMLQMTQLESYQAIAAHRTAGLAGQLNIETVNFGSDWTEDD